MRRRAMVLVMGAPCLGLLWGCDDLLGGGEEAPAAEEATAEEGAEPAAAEEAVAEEEASQPKSLLKKPGTSMS